MTLILRVHAGPYPRHACPVEASLPWPADTAVRLFQLPGGRPRACQLVPEPTSNTCRLHWMIAHLPAHAVQEYRVVLAPGRRLPVGRFRWRAENDRLTLDHDGIILLETAPVDSELEGKSLRIFAADRQPVVGDISWSGQVSQGCPIAARWHSVGPPHSGPVFAEMDWTGVWLDHSERPLAREVRWVRCYATPRGIRLIDFAWELRATYGPIRFAEGEDGLSLRLRLGSGLGDLEKTAPSCRDAHGLASDRRLAAWCHVAGPEHGFVCFSHPDNPGGPPAWLFRGSELIAMPWASFQSYKHLSPDCHLVIPTGEAVRWRYRLFIHEGKVPMRAIRCRFADYVEPPRIDVVAAS